MLISPSLMFPPESSNGVVVSFCVRAFDFTFVAGGRGMSENNVSIDRSERRFTEVVNRLKAIEDLYRRTVIEWKRQI